MIAVRRFCIILLLQQASAQPGAAACVNPSCGSPPCAANLVGDVGCTTVSGTEKYSHELTKAGGTIASNAHIFGPFEAGFGSKQKTIIEGWGCTDATVVYDAAGGLDLGIATQKVEKACGVTLPSISGTAWTGLIGYCGGHTGDYHFHADFACLYKEEGAHSTAVGAVGGHKIYGKWEDFTNKKFPYLDACGAHLGPTPESTTAIYHYHAQDRAPWSVGCHGPTATGTLVGVAACRALYKGSKGCASTAENIAIPSGTKSYMRWCPCFDAEDKNVLPIVELLALSKTEISYTTTTAAGSFGGIAAGANSGTVTAGTTANAGATAATGTTTGTTSGSTTAAGKHVGQALLTFGAVVVTSLMC